MALNLTRNTKVYFSTNTAATGFTAANTFELQVMEGYSLVQNTETQVIQPNEAGATPIRGNRTFNLALSPVDWEFSTYIRPRKPAQVTCDESVLWNALAGIKPKTAFASYSLLASGTRTGTAATATTSAAHGLAVGDYANIGTCTNADWDGTFKVLTVPTTASFTYAYELTPAATAATVSGATKVSGGQWFEATASSKVTFEGSNVHTLAPFTLIFKIDNTYYKVDSCAIDQAMIDFGIDQISMVKWSGKGTRISELTGTGVTEIATSATAPVTTANFITNKLSTVSLAAQIGGGGQAYTVPITSGSITISNNLTYLTPKILNTVNQPVGYFTGGRTISGTLSAYLRSGTTGDTGNLWSTLLAAATASTETKFALTVQVGGGTNSTRVDFDMQGAFLQIPTLDSQDIVSTNIQFNGQGYTVPVAAQTYDLEKNNDLVVRYFSA